MIQRNSLSVDDKHTHTHTHIYFIKQYRHVLSTYFCICPFQLPNWFYGVLRELVDETPITVTLVLSAWYWAIIGDVEKTNIVYQFKCTLGDCISENNSIYVGLTSTTLMRRLTVYIFDTSSIAQHLKKLSCSKTEFQKILTENTTILEQQNNKQK